MTTTKDMLDDAELAKSYITNSELSDDYKRTYLKLINLTTMATNGISTEEKIQKMTEAIKLLAVTQGMFMVGIKDRINEAVEKANKAQCSNCKAMKHVKQVEDEEKAKQIIENYKKKMGISDDDIFEYKSNDSISWNDMIKSILMKPYIYIVGGLMAISPFGVQILKTIFDFCGAK